MRARPARTPRTFTVLPKALWDRPDAERVDRSLQRLLTRRGDEIEFVVLFGSMARGDWSVGSDYDLLIGLRGEDGQRFVDRIGEFSADVEGPVDVFPYSRSEWRRMFENLSFFFFGAFEQGIVLWDQGGFAQMRSDFRSWRARGLIEALPRGWRIHAEPTAFGMPEAGLT